MELEAQTKDRKEVTEEPKRFMMQEMARGFSFFFDKALLVFLIAEDVYQFSQSIARPKKKKKQNYS